MTSRSRPLILTGAIALLALVAVLAAEVAGGPARAILASVGPIARHGAPVAAFVADLGGCLVLGGAVISGWAVRRAVDREAALRAVAIGSAVWTLAQLALLLTSYALATGQPVGSPAFGSDLPVYLGTDLGAWNLTSLVLAGATTVLAVAAAGPLGARAVAVCAGLSLLAKAMTGHASGSASHETATSTMLVHLLGAGVWVGGLAVLRLLPPGDRDAQQVLRRFSRLALVCWTAMIASGVWALAVRMTGPSDILTSAYVQIGLVKAVLLALLGIAGVMQRRLIADAAGPGGRFDGTAHRRLAHLELLLMGLALALAAAMSSSPPPASDTPATSSVAAILTGYPLPPAPWLGAVLGQWRPDVAAIAAAAVLLLAWWWPTAPRRTGRGTVLLLAAVALGLLVVCGPLAVYAKVLVSAHIVEHALLLLLVGPLLALAFGLRIPRRPPRWTAVAAGAAGPVLLALVYATPLARTVLEAHVAHLALLGTATGLGVLLGAAGAASRAARGAIGVATIVGAGALLVIERLIVPSWFGATGRTWLVDALADQQRAAWPLLVLGAMWLVSCGVRGPRTASARSAGAR